jgi:hypothetical protein
MAVNFPKGGEIKRMMTPEMKYQMKRMAGPSYPTSSESFFEKRMISRTGLVKFK